MSQFIAHLSQLLEAPRARRAVVAAAMAAALSGCSMIPAYERPAAPVPQAWPQGAAYTAPVAGNVTYIGWQQFFKDPALRRLLRERWAPLVERVDSQWLRPLPYSRMR